MAKGDITGWVKSERFYPHYLTNYKRKLREDCGLLAHIGGFRRNDCPFCGQHAMIGLDFHHKGDLNDPASVWIEECLNCGNGWTETPIYDMGEEWGSREPRS